MKDDQKKIESTENKNKSNKLLYKNINKTTKRNCKTDSPGGGGVVMSVCVCVCVKKEFKTQLSS